MAQSSGALSRLHLPFKDAFYALGRNSDLISRLTIGLIPNAYQLYLQVALDSHLQNRKNLYERKRKKVVSRFATIKGIFQDYSIKPRVQFTNELFHTQRPKM